MSKNKNKKILDDIYKDNYLSKNKESMVSAMLQSEIAGQRVFYTYLQQRKYDIDAHAMDAYQSDGIIGNALIECKLNEKEGGGPSKAYEELYEILPRRIKSNGEKLPYYRIYVELENFSAEVYDFQCKFIEKFD